MKLFFLLAFTILSFSGCKQPVKNDELENFEIFRTNFSEDLEFQKARSKYKLGGNFDLNLKHLDTTKFILHYKKEREAVTENMIYIQDTTYKVKLVFKMENGKWYFTDYIDTYND